MYRNKADIRRSAEGLCKEGARLTGCCRLNQTGENKMKKLMLGVCALVALGSVAFAGTETYSKDKTVIPPCPEWYGDNEVNLNLWGTYVFTGNEWRNDEYLDADHAFGGGADLKYFFHRY